MSFVGFALVASCFCFSRTPTLLTRIWHRTWVLNWASSCILFSSFHEYQNALWLMPTHTHSPYYSFTRLLQKPSSSREPGTPVSPNSRMAAFVGKRTQFRSLRLLIPREGEDKKQAVMSPSQVRIPSSLFFQFPVVLCSHFQFFFVVLVEAIHSGLFSRAPYLSVSSSVLL